MAAQRKMYKVGDVVLVKYDSIIWWPAYVKKQTEKQGRCFRKVCRFWEEMDECICPSSGIKPFDEKDPVLQKGKAFIVRTLAKHLPKYLADIQRAQETKRKNEEKNTGSDANDGKEAKDKEGSSVCGGSGDDDGKDASEKAGNSAPDEDGDRIETSDKASRGNVAGKETDDRASSGGSDKASGVDGKETDDRASSGGSDEASGVDGKETDDRASSGGSDEASGVDGKETDDRASSGGSDEASGVDGKETDDRASSGGSDEACDIDGKETDEKASSGGSAEASGVAGKETDERASRGCSDEASDADVSGNELGDETSDADDVDWKETSDEASSDRVSDSDDVYKGKTRNKKKRSNLNSRAPRKRPLVTSSDSDQDCDTFPLHASSVSHPKHCRRKSRNHQSDHVTDIDEQVEVEVEVVSETDHESNKSTEFEFLNPNLGSTQSSDSDYEVTVPEKIERDVQHSGIYVKLVTQSSTTSEGKKKKSTRKYDAYHHCPFCPPGKNMFSNFSKHLVIQKHIKEPEVKELKSLEPKDTDSNEAQKMMQKERKRKISLIRFRGDHEHNVRVLKKKRGEIVLGRRFNGGQFDVSLYGPCPKCFEWLQLRLISRHVCPGDRNGSVDSRGALLTQSMVMAGRITEEASQHLLQEVFSIMLYDEAGKVAGADALIVCLGNQGMAQNIGNRVMRGSYTSAIMRLASYMLINLRKEKVEKITPKGCSKSSDENEMWDYIRPQHFDRCVGAALATAFQDGDDLDELKSPSNAIKLGYDLKRLCNLKMGIAIRARDNVTREECRDFLQLMTSEWSTRVSRLARVRLAERQYTIQKQLPQPEDLVKLSTYLSQELHSFDPTDTSSANFRGGIQLIQAKLISYNRRRCGEIQALRIISYEQRKQGVSDVDEHMTRELTTFEKHLLQTQEVIMTRGKTGRAVPIIVPPECTKVLMYLTDSKIREKAEVHRNNIYVFAASRGMGVVRGYESLSRVSKKACLSQPGRITSVTLRKYMATISQVVNLNRSELDWVCDHLGHTVDVHRTHYRARSDVIERIEVAKLLLIQDRGIVNQFVGKTLKDIQFSDIVFSNTSSPEEASLSTSQPVSSSNAADVSEESLDDDNNYDADEVIPASRKKQRKKAIGVNRQKWTAEEEEELKKVFRHFFKSKSCPRQQDCEKAIKISKEKGGLIWKRPRDNIKKKVNNMIVNSEH